MNCVTFSYLICNTRVLKFRDIRFVLMRILSK